MGTPSLMILIMFHMFSDSSQSEVIQNAINVALGAITGFQSRNKKLLRISFKVKLE